MVEGVPYRNMPLPIQVYNSDWLLGELGQLDGCPFQGLGRVLHLCQLVGSPFQGPGGVVQLSLHGDILGLQDDRAVRHICSVVVRLY